MNERTIWRVCYRQISNTYEKWPRPLLRGTQKSITYSSNSGKFENRMVINNRETTNTAKRVIKFRLEDWRGGLAVLISQSSATLFVQYRSRSPFWIRETAGWWEFSVGRVSTISLPGICRLSSRWVRRRNYEWLAHLALLIQEVGGYRLNYWLRSFPDCILTVLSGNETRLSNETSLGLLNMWSHCIGF